MNETNAKKGINRLWTIWNLSEEVILLAAGVLAIIVGCLEGNEDLRNAIESVIAYAIAAFVILDGLLRLIMVLTKNKKEPDSSIMLISGFEITLGIVIMIVLKQILIEAMVYFIAVGTIVIGAMFLAFSIFSLVRKTVEKYFMPILEILFGGILIGVGLYIIILYQVDSDAKNRICLILTGSVLAIVAVALAILTLISCKKRKKGALVPTQKPEKKDGAKKSKKEKEEEPKQEMKEEEEPKIIEADVKEIESSPVQQIEHTENEND